MKVSKVNSFLLKVELIKLELSQDVHGIEILDLNIKNKWFGLENNNQEVKNDFFQNVFIIF